jgi:phage virion morphogenesis protein
MSGFSIELTGHEAALSQLGSAVDRLEHPAPLFDLIGAMLVTSTEDRFERETDPEGNPWPPSIRALTTGGKTLTDTAYLRNSLEHVASDDGVEVGTNVPYAAIHQVGGTIRPVTARKLVFEIAGRTVFADEVTIPKRAFLGLDDADEAAIADLAEDYVLEPFGVSDAGR